MTDSSGLSRRGFLQAGMMAGAGALAASALAGCAPRAQETPHPETASREAHTYWLGEEPAVDDADIVATRDTDFGKEPHRLSKIVEPPFYGCWFGGSLLTTTDGLRINEDMQVLTADNQVIEGLYAAGDVSGCFFSDNYPEYIVACACGRTCTEGRHVARLLAGDLD